MKNILGILAAGFIISGSLNAYADKTITVMSYNVHNGVGLDGKRDHNRLAEVIKAYNPHFVGIQEVDSCTNRSNHTYVLGDIAEAAGLIPTYAPAIKYDGGLYGIGILSKNMPDSVSRTPLPGREEQRALIVAYFKDVVVANSHLSLTPEDALESVKIVKTILDNAKNRPVIFMGDLNSHPDSPVIEELSRYFKIVSSEAPTFPADKPNERIDFIMVSNGTQFTVDSAEVVPEKIASDHRPILVTLTLQE
ncbi:MAG: endonuclease/exonuclease/phosphatase family protein [Paramuribaculum sp.]|nr:endonuclease/exonuclease/phosphatase family protein [Paramuribaculum sp.]